MSTQKICYVSVIICIYSFMLLFFACATIFVFINGVEIFDVFMTRILEYHQA